MHGYNTTISIKISRLEKVEFRRAWNDETWVSCLAFYIVESLERNFPFPAGEMGFVRDRTIACFLLLHAPRITVEALKFYLGVVGGISG